MAIALAEIPAGGVHSNILGAVHDRTEDFVSFAKRPPVEEVRYRARVHAAGLRLVAGVLELLDAKGAPRVRMAAPFVVDRGGRHHDTVVALEGCAADRDPAGPWGRPVTPPGAHECSLRVTWGTSGDRIRYPAVLDPAWTAATNTMTSARKGHTATLLSTGKVLIVGGETTSGQTTTHLKTAELFDPTTSTFAATTSMTDGRSFHAAVLLQNGNVLVAGGSGDSGVLSSSEIYDLSKPGFRSSGPLKQARSEPGATLLTTGDVLLTGGIDGSGTVLKEAEVFATAGEVWSVKGDMTERRTGDFVAVLNSGALAIAGITTTTGLADLADSDLYGEASGTFSAGPNLSQERFYFGGATLSNGNVLVAGGFALSLGMNTSTAELLDHDSVTWSSAGSLAIGRAHFALTAVSAGAAVATGGVVMTNATTVGSYLASAELYDPIANSWSALPDMHQPRAFHTATALPDGRLLVTGGEGSSGQLDTAELLSLDAVGKPCATGVTCTSGFCADGVCCASACGAPCYACTGASTGEPDGTCAPVLAAKDPRNDCTDDGATVCGNDGLCDGAGACQKYAKNPCAPEPCAANSDCTSGACADGICCDGACTGTCEACTAAKKGAGADGTCGPVAAGTDPDTECSTMGDGVCRALGTCDGSGSCGVPTAGTSCATAACSDRQTLAAAAVCGNLGDCTPSKTDCSPFACDAVALKCKVACTTDTDCAAAAHCTAGLCKKDANGVACTDGTTCASGNCADRYCCDSACDEQCEACDVANSEGTCSPVSGAPHGSRSACPGTGGCAGVCNGLSSTCIFRSGTPCGATTCTAGSESGLVCNALGACVTEPAVTCAPFACGTTSCKTSCTTSTDCATGATCEADGACVAPESGCADGGVATECAPYGCTGNACKTSCKADDDCAKGATCSAGKCVKGSSGGGCGCRIGSGTGSHDGLTFGALIALLGLALRRAERRRRGSRPDQSPIAWACAAIGRRKRISESRGVSGW